MDFGSIYGQSCRAYRLTKNKQTKNTHTHIVTADRYIRAARDGQNDKVLQTIHIHKILRVVKRVIFRAVCSHHPGIYHNMQIYYIDSSSAAVWAAHLRAMQIFVSWFLVGWRLGWKRKASTAVRLYFWYICEHKSEVWWTFDIGSRVIYWMDHTVWNYIVGSCALGFSLILFNWALCFWGHVCFGWAFFELEEIEIDNQPD